MKNTLKDLESGFDSAIEHEFHDVYFENCSECYWENKVIQSRRNSEETNAENWSLINREDTPWSPNPLG